jgi:hypothetical protein
VELFVSRSTIFKSHRHRLDMRYPYPSDQRQLEGSIIFGCYGVMFIVLSLLVEQGLFMFAGFLWNKMEYWGALILVGCLFLMAGLDLPPDDIVKQDNFMDRIRKRTLRYIYTYSAFGRSHLIRKLVFRLVGNTIHLFIGLTWVVSISWQIVYAGLDQGSSVYIPLFVISASLFYRSVTYWTWNWSCMRATRKVQRHG